MGTQKNKLIYTDGSDTTWAYIIVDNNTIIKQDRGYMPTRKEANDLTEAEAIFQAVSWCKDNPDNYILITDSKAALHKINGDWKDHTGCHRWKGITNIINEINQSPLPWSFSIYWKKRLSDKWMKQVDEICTIARNGR